MTKQTFPATKIQDLRNYGSSRLFRSINVNNSGFSGAPLELARLTLEEPRSITLTISYSTKYDSVTNDTRVQVRFGAGQSNQIVEVKEGVHTFPAQNIVVTGKRYDTFNMITAHPDCTVTAFIQVTDDPPSWVLYDEVP